MYELKRLTSQKSVVDAIERARHYRDLNQPEEAESICRDVLAIEPSHVEALKLLGLALTDRFPVAWRNVFDEAVATFAKLPSEYDRIYYTGVAWERLGKAQYDANQVASAANALEHALEHFDDAMKLAPEAADPVLRWNRCVRILKMHPELLRAIEAPHQPSDHGHYE